MRVNLCGRDVGMPEQRLKHAQVGPAGEQVGGKCVSQHMRAHSVRRDSAVGGKLPNNLEEADAAEVRLATGEKP